MIAVYYRCLLSVAYLVCVVRGSLIGTWFVARIVVVVRFSLFFCCLGSFAALLLRWRFARGAVMSLTLAKILAKVATQEEAALVGLAESELRERSYFTFFKA